MYQRLRLSAVCRRGLLGIGSCVIHLTHSISARFLNKLLHSRVVLSQCFGYKRQRIGDEWQWVCTKHIQGFTWLTFFCTVSTTMFLPYHPRMDFWDTQSTSG